MVGEDLVVEVLVASERNGDQQPAARGDKPGEIDESGVGAVRVPDRFVVAYMLDRGDRDGPVVGAGDLEDVGVVDAGGDLVAVDDPVVDRPVVGEDVADLEALAVTAAASCCTRRRTGRRSGRSR